MEFSDVRNKSRYDNCPKFVLKLCFALQAKKEMTPWFGVNRDSRIQKTTVAESGFLNHCQ